MAPSMAFGWDWSGSRRWPGPHPSLTSTGSSVCNPPTMLSPCTQRLYNGVRVLDHPCLPNVRRLDSGALPMIWEYHKWGIHLDRAHFQALSTRLQGKQEALAQEIETLAGEPLNHNSGDQVARLVFDVLKLKVRRRD